jgi:hypothetical protein
MEEWITRLLSELVDRVANGPMQFRFIVQPAMAMLLGMRDGVADSKAGAPPFLRGLVLHPDVRSAAFWKTLRRLRVPILFASVLDAIAQYLMFGHVRPLTALIVGTLLMGVPYSVARGIANRIRSRRFIALRPVPTHHKN